MKKLPWNRMRVVVALWVALVSWSAITYVTLAQEPEKKLATPPAAAGAIVGRGEYRSHKRLQPPAPLSSRALPKEQVYFVDAAQGDDAHDGNEAAPWRTVQYAIEQLKPGDTLCLRGGVYYERLFLSLTGTPDKPITIRGYPGERATIDGGVREFFDEPATAWEKVPGGKSDEYWSSKTYPNHRNFIGSFGDSMVALQTYYHRQDLVAEGEVFDWIDWDNTDKSDLKPVYLGPGLWFDRQTGRIHARLSHTHLPEIDNYQGETDPRKLPLVIAPFEAVPLRVDGAEYVNVQDIELRGAGYNTIVLDHAEHLTLDNLTVWCGTYGMNMTCTTDLRVTGCRFNGSLAPWTARADASKRDYPGRPHRNLSRFNTHSFIELDSGRESSVFATPQNDRWEIDHCVFTDSHDGVYLGGINVRFHHNVLDNMQDDGIYISPMYLRHKLDNKNPQVHIYQNEFRGALTALACGGPEPYTHDEIYVYRNVFDLKHKAFTARPTARRPEANFSTGKLIGDHGSPPWPMIRFYHNTVIVDEQCRDAAMTSLGALRPGVERSVFNNIFLHNQKLPAFVPPTMPELAFEDGNIYWANTVDPKVAAGLFDKFRKSPQFTTSQAVYKPGSTTNSRVINPFTKSDSIALTKDSPAVNTGVVIPAEWPDVWRDRDAGNPDVGALPLGVKRTEVGIGR